MTSAHAPRSSGALRGIAGALAVAGTAALLACESDVTGSPTPGLGSGLPPDGGGDSGSPRPRAHERLACDLPRAVEFCGGTTCHYDNAAAEVASELVLWNRSANQLMDDVEARLVGVPASYRNVPDLENCPLEQELLVDPSDIERSLILAKLEGRQLCGAEMPKFPYPEWGTVALPGPERAAFVSCIRDWVALLVEDYTQMQ